jgi:hypothetical protein
MKKHTRRLLKKQMRLTGKVLDMFAKMYAADSADDCGPDATPKSPGIHDKVVPIKPAECLRYYQ